MYHHHFHSFFRILMQHRGLVVLLLRWLLLLLLLSWGGDVRRNYVRPRNLLGLIWCSFKILSACFGLVFVIYIFDHHQNLDIFLIVLVIVVFVVKFRRFVTVIIINICFTLLPVITIAITTSSSSFFGVIWS